MNVRTRTWVIASTLLLAGGMMSETGTAAEAARNCTVSESRQFDFWIGEWTVHDRGELAGENVIESILDGCALRETWTGAKGGRGSSVNFFDRADDRWHQTWIDARGGVLFLSGRFVNGAMQLEGSRPAENGVPASRHRITWTALPDGMVRQLWESTTDGATNWQVQFDGRYTRRAKPAAAVSPPPPESSLHAIGWFEIPVRDFERARRFYGKILGAELPAMDAMSSRLSFLPHQTGKGVGGALISSDGRLPSDAGARVYLAAGPDLSVALARVAGAGGRVVSGKAAVGPGMGFFAIIVDPEGNTVGLHSPN